MVVSETAEKNYLREITQKSLSELPPGEILVRVSYSSLNYKDALSATGHKGVTKSYPHTPGIDAAGVVEESSSELWKPGDEVILTGYDLGMNTSGGWAEYVRVPAAWALQLPAGLTLKESMVYGTAGLTAALSLDKLERNGLRPDKGEVLVTGATGGVGSLAVAILAQAGYQVVASTGKTEAREFLRALGAKEVISRQESQDQIGKPLLKGRWAAVIDTVGGNILATAIKATQYGGSVACCGLVASPELQTTVYPFILRSVNLLGIDSAECPAQMRLQLWSKLASEWKPAVLQAIYSECSLEELEAKIVAMLQGKISGRTVVVINLA
jgi:putative YhdH/YhfP family quinone oxidoreductase